MEGSDGGEDGRWRGWKMEGSETDGRWRGARRGCAFHGRVWTVVRMEDGGERDGVDGCGRG